MILHGHRRAQPGFERYRTTAPNDGHHEFSMRSERHLDRVHPETWPNVCRCRTACGVRSEDPRRDRPYRREPHDPGITDRSLVKAFTGMDIEGVADVDTQLRLIHDELIPPCRSRAQRKRGHSNGIDALQRSPGVGPLTLARNSMVNCARCPR